MTAQEQYDLVIIGSGPGGYVAAVRAARLGLKTACVEKNRTLGGVCLNIGCIPSKALLDSSEYYHLAREHFAEHGILTGRVRLDLGTMMARKDRVVSELTGNVRKLLEGNGVAVFEGQARLVSPGEVKISRRGKKTVVVTTRNILLATGSVPIAIPGLEVDGEHIIDSSHALALTKVPKHLGIVGGGYIGLELGSVWRRLGARVTVIETLPRIATGLDGQVARALDRLLRSQGFSFHLNTRVTRAVVAGKRVKAVLSSEKGEEEATFDRLLISAGRKPATAGLGLSALGVETDPGDGRVLVDERYATSVPGIFAIGDLTAGPMLAHKASAEGVAAVECIAGRAGEVNYDAIPAVVYTWPEVASVGLTEDQVKERGIPYCVGSYPFSGAGRARCMGESEGFVKLIAHGKTDRVLGVHIIGPRAADIIAECVLALEFNASSEDIARTIHGHPTFSEALQEAAMAVRKCSIYAS